MSGGWCADGFTAFLGSFRVGVYNYIKRACLCLCMYACVCVCVCVCARVCVLYDMFCFRRYLFSQ